MLSQIQDNFDRWNRNSRYLIARGAKAAHRELVFLLLGGRRSQKHRFYSPFASFIDNPLWRGLARVFRDESRFMPRVFISPPVRGEDTYRDSVIHKTTAAACWPVFPSPLNSNLPFHRPILELDSTPSSFFLRYFDSFRAYFGCVAIFPRNLDLSFLLEETDRNGDVEISKIGIKGDKEIRSRDRITRIFHEVEVEISRCPRCCVNSSIILYNSEY